MTRQTRVAWAIGCVCAGMLGMAAQAADWWVDSLGSGDGTTPSTPTPNLQAAIDAAGANDTINISGAAGRSYTTNAFALPNNRWLINKRGLTLRDWSAKPRFVLPGGGGTGGSVNLRVVDVATNSVTLRNLRFEVSGNIMGASDNLIEITPSVTTGGQSHNVTIDGCEFVMTQFGGQWNQGNAIRQNSTATTNVVVKNCYFGNWDYGTGDGYRLILVNLAGLRCKVISNTFSNTSKCVSGTMQYSVISSNRFLNCRNARVYRSSVLTPQFVGILSGGYNVMRDCEISYNVVWNNNGLRTAFLAKDRETFNGATRIFNNTLYGADTFIGGQYFNDGTRWSPLVYNNLLVNNVYTNIYSIPNSTLTSTNIFLPASEIRNNMWFGGAAVSLTDPNSVKVTPVNTYNVNCAFVNTTDPTHADFLRPDAGATPEIMQGIGGGYPNYIGAVPPKQSAPRGFSILCQ